LSKDPLGLWSWVFLARWLFSAENIHDISLQARKEQLSQNIHVQRINYKRDDLNLVGNRSFLIGGRWPSFFPNLPDSHLPRLSLGSGGSNVTLPFGGRFRGARLDPHDGF
jgi:hypothetical protein